VTRKTATREDLTEAVQRTIGLSLGEARTLVSQVLETIATTLEHGETVKLSSFGSFVVRQKGERLGRNPKTLEPATIRGAYARKEPSTSGQCETSGGRPRSLTSAAALYNRSPNATNA
jgi:integration host factor subunit alpha